MSDILTRLLLDTKDYDSKLKKAKGSSQDFASSIGTKAAAAVGKFAAGIGIAMGGVEAFNKMMNSTQATGDAWNNTISACKSSVDMFFQSLASGDWNNFEGGLLRTIGRLKEVAVLQDMLGDAKLTMGFDVREFEREYVRLEGIIDNEKLGKAEREAAFSEMQTLIANFRKRVEATGKGAAETLVKELNTRFNQDFTLDDVKTYIKEVNNEFLNTETLQRLNEYKATLAKFKPGGSMAVDGGYVLTENQYRERHADLERLRILQDDNDENRKKMVSDYEYVLQMQQKMDEYHKRSLEKQNKIAGLNKVASGGSSSAKSAKVPVYVDGLNYQTEMGGKVLKWMNGEDVPVIKTKIEIEEEVIEEEDIAAKFVKSQEDKKKSIEDMNSALQSTADIFGSLGSIAGSAGNDFLAATMQSMGSIAEMIVQLQALSTAQGVGSASKLPFPANLAAIATVVATIASVFGSLPKFADGGVVGGSSYFGDKLLARVNSGEAILNQRQQARALSLMEGGNVRVSGDVRLNGKDIYISLRNYLASSGNKL
jgi:hypothetical protein